MPAETPEVITTNKPLQKKWLITFFSGTTLALGSELLNQNGFNGPVTQGSFVWGVVMMVAGCIALVLSEKKQKWSGVEPEESDIELWDTHE